ncbi:MAG: hypothetical protein RLZZ58_1024, partial [Pseudomonadota bacterium]
MFQAHHEEGQGPTVERIVAETARAEAARVEPDSAVPPGPLRRAMMAGGIAGTALIVGEGAATASLERAAAQLGLDALRVPAEAAAALLERRIAAIDLIWLGETAARD